MCTANFDDQKKIFLCRGLFEAVPGFWCNVYPSSEMKKENKSFKKLLKQFSKQFKDLNTESTATIKRARL
jgi:hypothetical protein